MSNTNTSSTLSTNWLKSFFERNSNYKSLNKNISSSEPKKRTISMPNSLAEDELSEWINMETRKRARILVNESHHPGEDNIEDEVLEWVNCHKSKLAESLKSKK